MQSVEQCRFSHERAYTAPPRPRPVARPLPQPTKPIQPRQIVQESRRFDLREQQHTTYTLVAVQRLPEPPVYRDPVRVPPPVEVTWQQIMPYSQNITGQLFDFYDTDTQGEDD